MASLSNIYQPGQGQVHQIKSSSISATSSHGGAKEQELLSTGLRSSGTRPVGEVTYKHLPFRVQTAIQQTGKISKCFRKPSSNGGKLYPESPIPNSGPPITPQWTLPTYRYHTPYQQEGMFYLHHVSFKTNYSCDTKQGEGQDLLWVNG